MTPGAAIRLPQSIRDEIGAEAQRLDRKISWLVERAWEIARAQIRSMPAPIVEPAQRFEPFPSLVEQAKARRAS